MYKKIGIILITFALSFWFWFVIKSWLTGEALFTIPSLWINSLVFLIILSAFLSAAFLVLYKEKFIQRWILAWLVGLSYLIVFGFSFLNLIALAVIVLIPIYAIKSTEIEVRERIKFNSYSALRRGLPAIVVPLLLAASFSYFQILSTNESETQIEGGVSFRDAIESSINHFLGFESIEERLKQEDLLGKGLFDKAIEKARDIFYEYADKYQEYIPPILAFGLFLILWGLSFIFVYLSLYLAKLIIWILKKTNFIQIEEVEVKAERLIF